MPSIRHQALAALIPRLRRSGEVADVEHERRRVLASQRRADPSPPRVFMRGVEVRLLDGAGVPTYDVRPAGRATPRSVLYVHGGGYVGTVDRFHWLYVARLARRFGVRVVVPVYPLAPEHSWHDAHPPLIELFERIAVESAGGVTLAGDSAGGGLALALAQQVATRPGPQPTGLVLISPWVDLTGSSPGTEDAARRDPWLTLSKLHLYASWWAGGDDVARPELSPVFGELASLPPAVVFCGTRDLLHPQVRLLVQRGRDAGWPLTYWEELGLLHVYPILPVPEARDALDQLAPILAG
jgi:epsilon-lactone hydrolase